jgi:hypothetical protein
MPAQVVSHRIFLDMSACQAEALKSALELYARILIGQVEEAFQWWGGRRTSPLVICLKLNLTGFDINANWSIAGEHAPLEAKIAYGLHKVLADRLAMVRDPKGGCGVDRGSPDTAVSYLEPLATISGTTVTGFHLGVTSVQLRIIADALEAYRRTALQDYDVVADLWLEHGRAAVRRQPYERGILEPERVAAGQAEAVRPLLAELTRQVRRSIDAGDTFMVGPREEHRIAFEMEKIVRAFMVERDVSGTYAIRGDTAFTIDTAETAIAITS